MHPNSLHGKHPDYLSPRVQSPAGFATTSFLTTTDKTSVSSKPLDTHIYARCRASGMGCPHEPSKTTHVAPRTVPVLTSASSEITYDPLSPPCAEHLHHDILRLDLPETDSFVMAVAIDQLRYFINDGPGIRACPALITPSSSATTTGPAPRPPYGTRADIKRRAIVDWVNARQHDKVCIRYIG